MKRILFFAGLIFSFSTLFGQAPEGYYVEAIGKSGQALKEAIRDIAKRGVKKHSYNWDVDQTDQIPEKPGKVKLIYTLKEENVGNHKASGKSGYNREHIWPKSLMVPSKSEMWDSQNLRASEPYENSKRGNKRYGSYMPPSVSRGDCARICFFMSLVYDWNIDIVGDQDLLISWSSSDPVDNFEIRRNNELQKSSRK